MGQSKFDFTQDGLTLTFKDLTPGAAAWVWNFGDGTPADNTQNPVHDYAAPGVYAVSLTTDGDAAGTMVFNIVVSEVTGMNLTIADMVKYEAPDIDTTSIIFNQYVKAWQAHLQPLVQEPFTPVDIEHTFNQAYWPPVFNQLIAKLVIYDSISTGARTSVIQTSSGKGGLKKLEVGPSNAEWYDLSDTMKQILQEGGMVDIVKAEVCMIAAMAGIILPFCPLISPQLFIVGYKPLPPIYPISISQG